MPIQAIQLLRPAVQLLEGHGWDHEGEWERFFEVWHLCCGRFFGMFHPHISPFSQRRRWIPKSRCTIPRPIDISPRCAFLVVPADSAYSSAARRRSPSRALISAAWNRASG